MITAKEGRLPSPTPTGGETALLAEREGRLNERIRDHSRSTMVALMKARDQRSKWEKRRNRERESFHEHDISIPIGGRIDKEWKGKTYLVWPSNQLLKLASILDGDCVTPPSNISIGLWIRGFYSFLPFSQLPSALDRWSCAIVQLSTQWPLCRQRGQRSFACRRP